MIGPAQLLAHPKPPPAVEQLVAKRQRDPAPMGEHQGVPIPVHPRRTGPPRRRVRHLPPVRRELERRLERLAVGEDERELAPKPRLLVLDTYPAGPRARTARFAERTRLPVQHVLAGKVRIHRRSPRRPPRRCTSALPGEPRPLPDTPRDRSREPMAELPRRDEDLPANRLVVRRQRVPAVQAEVEERIEVHHVRRRYLQEPGRVALAPEIERRALQGDDLAGRPA